MAQQPYRESWVDRQIREAQERGEFDNLPGAGKPLADLGDPNDPDWWVRRYIQREKLDVSGALPTPLALRKEAASFPGSLADVAREEDVREILEDFNRRVKVDRLRPAVGAMPPLIARTVDVDEVMEQWRELRRELARAVAARRPAESAPPPPPPRWWQRQRWWRWRRPRG
jgi:hypothetical protein